MLSINLDSIFSARGIRRKYAFLKGLGMSHMVARRLANGDMKSVKTFNIEKICLALHCTPNDLMRWEPEGAGTLSPAHPLHQLNREKDVDLLNEINKLPLSRMNELKKLLRSMTEDNNNL